MLHHHVDAWPVQYAGCRSSLGRKRSDHCRCRRRTICPEQTRHGSTRSCHSLLPAGRQNPSLGCRRGGGTMEILAAWSTCQACHRLHASVTAVVSREGREEHGTTHSRVERTRISSLVSFPPHRWNTVPATGVSRSPSLSCGQCDAGLTLQTCGGAGRGWCVGSSHDDARASGFTTDSGAQAHCTSSFLGTVLCGNHGVSGFQTGP